MKCELIKKYFPKIFFITLLFFIIFTLLLSTFIVFTGNTISKLSVFESALIDDIKPAMMETGMLNPSQGAQLVALVSMIYLVIKKLILITVIFLFFQSIFRTIRDIEIWKKVTSRTVSVKNYLFLGTSTLFLGLYITFLALLFFYKFSNVLLSLIMFVILFFVYESTLLYIQSIFLTKKRPLKLLAFSYGQSSLSLLIVILAFVIYSAIIYFLLSSVSLLSSILVFAGLVFFIGLRMAYLYRGVNK